MSLSREIEISDFSAGLITDLDDAELPKEAASRLVNGDVRNKKLETLPGLTAVNTGLNASFIKLAEEQFKFTVPSEQTVTLVYGTLSGAHKLYIKPYLSSAGAWVDSWQELTEKESSLTADAGTNTTTIVDAALSSTTDDYYNGWIIYNTTRSRAAIITDYVGSTKTLTLSWAIASQTTGDSYFISRNPIYEVSGLSLFSPSSANGCRFLAQDNAIDIVTGSDQSFSSDNASRKSDLRLGVSNGYQALNDSDLNFTGFHLTVKHPQSLQPFGLISISAAVLGSNEQEIPVPTSPTLGYVVVPVAVYDGYQEGPLFKGGSTLSNKPTDGTYYTQGLGYTIVSLAASRRIKIDITLYYGATNTNSVPLLTPYPNLVADVHLMPTLNRRITGIRFYMAEIDGGGNDGVSDFGKVTSEFRFVEEVKLNSASWAGTGPDYTQTVYVTGDEWIAGAGIDIADRQGYSSVKVHANANFIATAKRRVAVANVFADQQRQSFVFFSAINSDELNTPDVIPHTSFIDLSLYGIPKIIGFLEALGFYVAIGENQVVKIDAATLSVDKNIQTRGGSSANAFVNANGLLYFVNLEDIYYYHPSQDVVRSIATGFIREAWRALSTSNKQAAAIGYDRRFEKLVIAAGTTIYTYNLPAAFADPLSSDTQAIGSWAVYDVSKTFLRFYTDVLGRCIGIASDGIAYEVFSSGVANTMIYEKVLGESLIAVDALRMTYNATATVTVELYDMARTSSYPIQTYKFPAQSLHMQYNHYKGCKLYRPKIKISAPIGTTISAIALNPQNIDSN